MYKKPTEGTIKGSKEDFRRFRSVHGLALDNENIYVTECHRIVKINSEGVVSVLAGSLTPGLIYGKGKNAQFSYPHGIDIDSKGNLIVADSGNNRICRVTPDGYVETIAGAFKGFKDGVGIDAKFDNPFNLRIDKNDNVYIVDVGNKCIRKFFNEGFVMRL